MKLITVTLPDNHNIFHFGDKHDGSVLSSNAGWNKLVSMMHSEYDGCKNNYGIEGGDDIEAICADDPRFAPEKLTEPLPLTQIERAVEIRKTIASKLLVKLLGNHERKLWRFGNITEKICKELNVPYGTYCVSEDTEILTDKGWRTYSQLKAGGLALSYDIEEQNLSWQKIDDVYSFLYKGEMIGVKSKCLDILMTPNHRNVVRTQNKKYIIRQAKDLVYTDRIVVGGKYIPPNEAALPDDIVELIGWIVTEGYIVKNSNCKSKSIKISQADGKGSRRLKKLFTRLGINLPNHIVSLPSGKKLQEFYVPSRLRDLVMPLIPEKQLTVNFLLRLSRQQLQLLYQTIVLADGYCGDSGTCVIQNKGTTADSIQILGILLGRQANFCPRNDKCLTISMNIRQYRYVRGNKSIQQYDGVVWCPKLKYGTWVARRNGKVFITGNTVKVSILDKRGNLMYKIYETHGLRNITSTADDPKRRQTNLKLILKRQLKFKAADCAIMIKHHVHKLLVCEPEKELYLTDDGKKIKQNYTHWGQNEPYIHPDARWYGCAGSFLKLYGKDISGYAEIMEYDPVELGFLVTKVRNRKIVSVEPVYLDI